MGGAIDYVSIRRYIQNLRGELVLLLSGLRGAGIERIHFAWAGGFGGGTHYRLHGPTLLISTITPERRQSHPLSVAMTRRMILGSISYASTMKGRPLIATVSNWKSGYVVKNWRRQ